ncbi:2-phospho-L-lactate guanylyltransferase [Natronocalculus amylovorans]|uniref:2-phospho-L-lactate guanylyltransferase n=1 Tax=Natronocalculus amylovorans TaxID=2917812 RepID=A0AAE3FW94_9EURY|nr:2-phospho-L-lactate guanylyltransferase [Natronocalculus amylovorans]MCL9816474.1 2-phospho-L-lactate guanylyltransferase [Natronocalculus amylovorans]NUE00920.1 2-phospho-L-lactate guanylyltransferase [Halorubraceae archaeon YAN]
MEILIPFDNREPKTRLSPVLNRDERQQFADAMLSDVLSAIKETNHTPHLLVTTPTDRSEKVTVDDRSLTAAVNKFLSTTKLPVAILMSDLPLCTPAVIERLFSYETPITIAPGLGGGTNALVIRDRSFSVDYHGYSYRDHCQHAASNSLAVSECDSRRLATDVDEPTDLREVVLHSDGAAATWLRTNGFSLNIEQKSGRVSVKRDENNNRE